MKHKFLKISYLTVAILLLSAESAFAEGRLTVYCTVQYETCEKLTQEFARRYHAEAKFVTNPTGTTLSRLKMEKNSPQADIWYGGTIDYHIQARELGLLEPYRSPQQAKMPPKLREIMKDYGEYTGIASVMVLGIGINKEKMKALGIAEKDYPKCWKDLLDPRLKGEVQIPDPQASGTTYTFMANLIQLWGEDAAFDYLKKMHRQVARYVSSSMTGNNLARGEVAITVGFIHDYAKFKAQGVPLQIVLPCDGTSYSLDAVSIMKNARNLDNAKLFMDFVLGKEGQEIPWKATAAYQIPANAEAETSPLSPKLNELKLIDFDFKRFGSKDEGKRIVDKWVREVKMEK